MKPRALLLPIPPLAARFGVTILPAWGWLRDVWSAETAMILYFLETVVVVLIVGFGLRLIVPDVDEAGRDIRARRNKLVADYRWVMFGFTGVIGVFLATILLLFLQVSVPWAAVGWVMTAIVALQLFAYGWEAYRLRPLDIADAEKLINRDIGRIAVLHLGVFFGAFLAAVRAEWFVWPFLILKTVVDIGGLLATAGVLEAEEASSG